MHQVPTIFMMFAGLSLLAFGGGNVVLHQVEKDVVTRHHWITGDEFVHLYALGQLAPGPSAMYMSGIGFVVAGVPGALAAGIGFILPSTVLMMVLNSLEHIDRWRTSPWRHALAVGMAPAAIGLVAAGAIRLAQIEVTVVHGWQILVVAAIALGVIALTMWTKLNPALMVLGGGMVAVFAFA